MRRGFTLVETLVTLVLLGMALSIGVMSLSQAPRRAGVRGLAEALAEELRFARHRAEASGQPCALALPSANGTIGHAQAFYLLEGWSRPRITRVTRTDGDFPRTYIFAGRWGAAPVPPGSRMVNGGDLSLARWQAPHPEDPLFVFLPSGAVVSNQPVLEGAYRVVVCAGLSYAGDTLTGAVSPTTVALSPLGEVRLEAGPVVPATGTNPGPSAPPPAWGGPANADPDRLDLTVLPLPNPASLPPGASATVKLKGHLTMISTATDPDGDPLTLQWTTTEVQPGGPGGVYSDEARVEMEWDAENEQWKAVWEWRPPPQAQPGDRYRLTATAADGRGGSISRDVGATGLVEILAGGKLAFVSARDGGFYNVYTMNADGTDATRLTNDTFFNFEPRWSPDGSKLLFTTDRYGQSEVLLMERDGSQVRRLTNGAALGLTSIMYANFTPDGTAVVFVGDRGGVVDVYMTTVLGTDPKNPGVPGAWRMTTENWPGSFGAGGGVRSLMCHPDGERLVVSGGTSPNQDLYEVLYAGVPTPIVTRLTTFPQEECEPALSLDGSRLAWHVSNDWYVYNAPPGAPGSLGAGTPINSVESPVFSPDGQRITYQSLVGPGERAIFVSNVDGSNVQRLTQVPGDCDGSQWSVR